MPNENQGNPMNTGYGNSQDILGAITQQLNKSFGSLETQLKQIVSALGGQQELMKKMYGSSEKAEKNSREFLRNFGKSSAPTDQGKDVASTLKSVQKELTRISKVNKLTSGSSRSSSVEDVVDAELKTLRKKYTENLQGMERQLLGLQEQMKQNNLELQNKQRELARLESSWGSGQGKSRKQKKQYTRRKTELTSRINTLQNVEQGDKRAVEELNQNLHNLYEQLNKRSEAIEEKYEDLRQINSVLGQSYSQLGSLSPAFSKFLEKQDKVSENDRFREAVNNAKDVVAKAIETLTEKINGASGEEKILLEAQLKKAKDQEKYLKNLTPIKNNLAAVASSVKGVIFSTFINMGKGLITGLENRYLDTYTEGFQRVYQSIETTRNEISARMRFDQGQFDDFQNNIQARIESEGLTGAISLVDVNEAVQSLVAAGITNQEVIESLAYEQAKLKYLGSDINLQNEETLSNLMAYMQRGASIENIESMLDTWGAQIKSLGTEYGSTMSMANGGADALLNQMLNMSLTSGKSFQQFSEDLQDATVSQFDLYSKSISKDLLTSMLNEIQQGNITQSSPLYGALLQRGLSPKTMVLSTAQQQSMLVQALSDATISAEGNKDWLKPLMDTWGISASFSDMSKFLDGITQDGIKTSQTSQQRKQAEDMLKTNKDALTEATYKSITEKTNKEYENTMTDLAQQAEHIYEGDQLFLSEMEAVKHGVEDIINILLASLGSSITGGFGGLGGGAGGTGGTGSLLTGRSVAGGALGFGVGALEAGTAIYSDLQKGDWETVGQDPNAWRGVGTMVGSLSGNPLVGMAVGELFAGANRIGNYWAEEITDMSPTDPRFMKSMMSDEGLLGIKKTFLDFDYADMSNYLMQAAKDLSEAAQEQLNTSNAQLANVKDMSITEKKNLLLQGNYLDEQENTIDLQMLNAKSEEEINKLFAETVQKDWELQKQKAEYDLKVANWQAESSESRAGMYESIEKYSKKGWDLSADYGKAEDGTRKIIYNAKGEGRALTNLEHLFGESNETERKQLFDLFNSKPEGMSIDAFIAQNIPEAAEDPDIKKFYTEILGMYESNKKIYDEQTKKFQEYWASAKTKAGTDELGQVWQVYQEMRQESGQTDFSGIDMDGSFPAIDPQTNLPKLKTGYADLLQPEYYEGKFRSGLSRVPRDNYTAVLHEGERILTKREAEVYNNIIPDIVEAATTDNYYRTDRSSSNVMSTNIYGSSYNFHDDISDQTDSLTSVLNEILKTIQSLFRFNGVKSGINPNILGMNSDVTQVNTSY